MSSAQETMLSESSRFTGIVKWFNTKTGFGFITVCGEGDHAGKDIFAHHSGVRVSNMQYKYLVQGEYVDFNLVKSDNENHEFNAADITGVLGGPVMCETRRIAQENQPERTGDRPDTSYSSRRRSDNDDDNVPRTPRNGGGRGGPPRNGPGSGRGAGRGRGSKARGPKADVNEP
jgi:cold shock CspA family protein